MSPLNCSRRRFLRGAGACLPLPFLPSLERQAFAAAPVPKPPKRMAFVSFGFSVLESSWYPDPKQAGRDWTITPGLTPMARHKGDFTIVQGLMNAPGVDAHWASTFWLTGADRFSVPGKTFHNTISADQVAASHLGGDTRFPSLTLTSGGAETDGHGPGLSLAWDAAGKPIAGFTTPVAVFHKLFSAETLPLETRAALLARRQSVLDVLLDGGRSLGRRLGKDDTDKLDEYMQGIREIEVRLSKEERWLGVPKPKVPLDEPGAGLKGKEEIRLMYDILVAALQTDSTRVATYRQPLQTLLESIGIKTAAHGLSHTTGPDHPNAADVEACQARDRTHAELLAHLFDRLKAVKEADGSTLFDNTCLAYGSNIRWVHSVDNPPTLLAGGAAGIKLGELIVVPNKTPLSNVWLTLLKGCGVPVEKHGNSTGVLDALVA